MCGYVVLILAFLSVAGLTLAAGGRLALVSSSDGSIQITDIHNGTSLSNKYLPPRIRAERSGSPSQFVAQTEEEKFRSQVPSYTGVAVAADGDLVALAEGYTSICLTRLSQPGQVVMRLTCDNELSAQCAFLTESKMWGVTGLAFDPSGSLLAATGRGMSCISADAAPALEVRRPATPQHALHNALHNATG
jgi:hypothetical protein